MTYIPEWMMRADFLLATTAGLIVFADCVVRWGDAFAKLRREMNGDACGPRPHASHRACSSLGHPVSVAIAGDAA